MNQYPPRFFLSAQTPLGFVSRLSILTDPSQFSRVWLLKGATRAKRSALIAALADSAEESGKTVFRVLDPFAPALLEAAFWGRTAILDAAEPHPIEPRYPGVLERVIWLGDCYEERTLLAGKEEIIAHIDEGNRLCEQARRYLGAAEALWGDRFRMAHDATDQQKIERQADRIAAQEFTRSRGLAGESICMLSSTNGASAPLGDAAQALDRVVLIEDEAGPSAALLLEALRRRAAATKQQVLCGFSPFAPYERLEQLVFPALSLGFFTANDRLCAAENPQRVINARRFTDRDTLNSYKNRMSFHRKAMRQMNQLSSETLALAQQHAEQLERCYDEAFYPARFEGLSDRLTGEFEEA